VVEVDDAGVVFWLIEINCSSWLNPVSCETNSVLSTGLSGS
jgi:hypothetical protein